VGQVPIERGETEGSWVTPSDAVGGRGGRAETVPRLLRDAVEAFGGREAVVRGNDRRTFRDLERDSAELALGLLAIGCGKGARVGILFPNGPDWVVAFLAAMRIGAIAIPINTFSRGRELCWLLRHADVQVLLTCDAHLSHDYLARLEESIPELASRSDPELYLESLPMLRRVFVWGQGRRSWAESGPESLTTLATSVKGLDDRLLVAIEEQVAAADQAIVIYTSGSTADPKGVEHSQGTVAHHSSTIAALRELRETDRVYLNMPFFWVGGLLLGPLSGLHSGACIHCDAPLDEAEILDLLLREHITRLSSTHPPTSLLKAHSSFDPRAHAHVRELSEGGQTQVFGMSESFGWHSGSPFSGEGSPEPTSSLGRAIEGVERAIVDPESGQPLAPGESGELVLRGPSLMQGYYKRTREEVFTAGGWFRTGDRCRLDA
jgi:acyl-CoA synthetase (AMP-forming)/AMP-acid ligase II